MRGLIVCLALVFARGQFLEEKGETGFIDLEGSYKLFYWLFHTRDNNKSAPLVMWLEGGPGCSALISIFAENGPFRFGKEGNLERHEESWNKRANLLFIDQPLGTGYSNSSNTTRIPEDEEAAWKDFIVFLRKFFEGHPDLRNKDFYLTGHSYAGHYVPYFSAKILQEQKGASPLPLNFKGVAIGNGFFKGSTQALSYAKFNLEHGLYDRPFSYIASSIVYHLLDIFANIGMLRQAFFFFDIGRQISNGHKPRFNMYNINLADAYNRTYLTNFANNDTRRNTIGVADRSWIGCSPYVMMRMVDKDFYADMTPYFQEIVKRENNLKVILYSGMLDWITNTEGVFKYLEEVSWEAKEEFMAKEWITHKVNENDTVEYKQASNFFFYKVPAAGHMICVEKPKVGTFILNKLMGLS